MELEFNILEGKTLSNIENIDNEELLFTTIQGEEYRMYHDQNCCECVYIEDICGDLQDLIGSPILKASEDTNSETNPEGVIPEYQNDSFTWTFYNIATAKGHVTVRWYGSSKGYYSESVSFVKEN